MNLKRICFWKDNIDVLYALVGATLYVGTLGRKLTNLISVNSVNLKSAFSSILHTPVKCNSLPELLTMYNQYIPLNNKAYIYNTFLMHACYIFL